MTTTSPTIAETIRAQIGVSTLMELGAHNLRATATALLFTIKRDNGRLAHVSVELDRGSDTYTVRSAPAALRSKAAPTVLEGVYVDSLRTVLLSLLRVRG